MTMFGMIGQRRRGASSAPPPFNPEMVADSGFDDPSKWDTNGGAVVTGSQIRSLNDDGSLPTMGELRPGAGSFLQGIQYRLRCQVATNLGATFRILIWSGIGTQLIGTYHDGGQLIDETFIADDTYTSVLIEWFEIGIRLNDLSIVVE